MIPSAMQKCCKIKGLTSNYYGTQEYLWLNISEDRRYFTTYGSTFIESHVVPYGNMALMKHLGTWRIKRPLDPRNQEYYKHLSSDTKSVAIEIYIDELNQLKKYDPERYSKIDL